MEIEEKKQGEVTIKFPNGKIYEGDLKNDKPHGKGTLTFADGRMFQVQSNKGIAETISELIKQENEEEKKDQEVFNDIDNTLLINLANIEKIWSMLSSGTISQQKVIEQELKSNPALGRVFKLYNGEVVWNIPEKKYDESDERFKERKMQAILDAYAPLNMLKLVIHNGQLLIASSSFRRLKSGEFGKIFIEFLLEKYNAKEIIALPAGGEGAEVKGGKILTCEIVKKTDGQIEIEEQWVNLKGRERDGNVSPNNKIYKTNLYYDENNELQQNDVQKSYDIEYTSYINENTKKIMESFPGDEDEVDKKSLILFVLCQKNNPLGLTLNKEGKIVDKEGGEFKVILCDNDSRHLNCNQLQRVLQGKNSLEKSEHIIGSKEVHIPLVVQGKDGKVYVPLDKNQQVLQGLNLQNVQVAKPELSSAVAWSFGQQRYTNLDVGKTTKFLEEVDNWLKKNNNAEIGTIDYNEETGELNVTKKEQMAQFQYQVDQKIQLQSKQSKIQQNQENNEQIQENQQQNQFQNKQSEIEENLSNQINNQLKSSVVCQQGDWTKDWTETIKKHQQNGYNLCTNLIIVDIPEPEQNDFDEGVNANFQTYQKLQYNKAGSSKFSIPQIQKEHNVQKKKHKIFDQKNINLNQIHVTQNQDPLISIATLFDALANGEVKDNQIWINYQGQKYPFEMQRGIKLRYNKYIGDSLQKQIAKNHLFNDHVQDAECRFCNMFFDVRRFNRAIPISQMQTVYRETLTEMQNAQGNSR